MAKTSILKRRGKGRGFTLKTRRGADLGSYYKFGRAKGKYRRGKR